MGSPPVIQLGMKHWMAKFMGLLVKEQKNYGNFEIKYLILGDI